MGLSTEPGAHSATAWIQSGQFGYQEGSEVMRLYYFEKGLTTSIGDWTAISVSYSVEAFDATSLDMTMVLQATMVDFMAAMNQGNFDGLDQRELTMKVKTPLVAAE